MYPVKSLNCAVNKLKDECRPTPTVPTEETPEHHGHVHYRDLLEKFNLSFEHDGSSAQREQRFLPSKHVTGGHSETGDE